MNIKTATAAELQVELGKLHQKAQGLETSIQELSKKLGIEPDLVSAEDFINTTTAKLEKVQSEIDSLVESFEELIAEPVTSDEALAPGTKPASLEKDEDFE